MSILSEVFAAFLIVWISNWVFESRQLLKILSFLKFDQDNNCIFGYINQDFLGNMFRGYSFILVLYFISSKAVQDFPLPFTWIFEDFQKFLLDYESVKIFRYYLLKKEPRMLSVLESLLLNIGGDFE